MSDQLALIEPPPKPLPDRQQYALEEIGRAGHDGLSSDAIGALLHERRGKHHRDDRCRWCAKEGRQVALALDAKELVRYRGRLKVWQLRDLPADARAATPHPAMLANDQPLPF